MTNQRLQIIAFYILLGAAALVVFLMWLPFLKLVALGAILAVLFLPVYRNISKRSGNELLASWLTIIIILLIVIVPLYIIGQLLFNELYSLIGRVTESGGINTQDLVSRLPESLQGPAGSFFNDLGAKISDIAGTAFESAAGIASNVANFFISFFLVFFTTYYLLRDGENFKKFMAGIFPLSEQHENMLVSRLEQAISGVVKGSFLVALSQGTVATIGFLIFGVPAAFLWGAFTVLAALVPTVGTALSVVPAVLYLLATGHVGQGIGLAIWGAVAVGLIDNVISPKLIGSRTNVHPLLILFGVLGGLQLFGFIGFLLGPIIMAVFVTLLDIYRTDLKNYLEK